MLRSRPLGTPEELDDTAAWPSRESTGAVGEARGGRREARRGGDGPRAARRRYKMECLRMLLTMQMRRQSPDALVVYAGMLGGQRRREAKPLRRWE